VLFTPNDLEGALVQQLQIWTADMRFKSPHDRGAVPVPIGVYLGYIPSNQAGPPAIQQQPKAPSIAVRVSSGRYRRLDGDATVNFAILTWDDNLNRHGYMDVQNIINRIVYGLMENVVIAKAFVLLQDTVSEESITYDLIDDPTVDFFPYFLGMATAKFGIMSPGPDRAPYNDTGPDTLTFTWPDNSVSDPVTNQVVDPRYSPP
jgi:hypothetical protein